MERDQAASEKSRAREPSDHELLDRVGKADAGAFELLYTRYYQPVFRFAYRMTRCPEQIEEIINDVMFVVWNKVGTFNHQSKVSTWILGIAYKKCLKAISERSQYEHVSLEDVEEFLPGIPDKAMKDVELEDWLTVALSRLPPDQRAVLDLTYHHGLHYSEIAEVMGCPENTIKTRMFHARKKIQSMMPDLLDIPQSGPQSEPL